MKHDLPISLSMSSSTDSDWMLIYKIIKMGRFLLKAQVAMSEGLIRWLFRWGSDVKVIHPQELVSRMKEEAEKYISLITNLCRYPQRFIAVSLYNEGVRTKEGIMMKRIVTSCSVLFVMILAACWEKIPGK